MLCDCRENDHLENYKMSCADKARTYYTKISKTKRKKEN